MNDYRSDTFKLTGQRSGAYLEWLTATGKVRTSARFEFQPMNLATWQALMIQDRPGDVQDLVAAFRAFGWVVDKCYTNKRGLKRWRGKLPRRMVDLWTKAGLPEAIEGVYRLAIGEPIGARVPVELTYGGAV